MTYLPAQTISLLADVPVGPYYYDDGSYSLWSYVCCGACCCVLLLIVIAAIVGIILYVSKSKKK